MMNKGILPLSFSGGAALISIITGFINGVSPGILLFRGLFSALIAGAFIFLSGWLISTYLPELSDLGVKKSPVDDSADTPGSRVNIVMSDDDLDGAGNLESGDSLEDDSLPSSGFAGGTENEIAETSGSVHNNKPEDPDLDTLDSEGLDILPNLDSLEMSMGGGGSAQTYDDSESIETEAPVSSMRAEPKKGEHGDPEEIAKAVKTVLARDKQR